MKAKTVKHITILEPETKEDYAELVKRYNKNKLDVGMSENMEKSMEAVIVTIDEEFQKSRKAGSKDKAPRKKRKKKLTGEHAAMARKLGLTDSEYRRRMREDPEGFRIARKKNPHKNYYDWY